LEKQVLGAWKGEVKNSFLETMQMKTVFITDKTIDLGDGLPPQPVTLLSQDNSVLVQITGNTLSLIPSALTLSDNETLIISFPGGTSWKLGRTTETDIQTIRAEQKKKSDQARKDFLK